MQDSSNTTAKKESVWDYPRPPRVEATSKHILIEFNGVVLAESRRAQRVLETSHPPVYYLPTDDVRMSYLEPFPRTTFCEWKGRAEYYSVIVGDERADGAAWYYPNPTPAFTALKNHLAFYAHLMSACYVNGEKVRSQPGGFYGGWITSDIIGPFKGGPKTWGW